MTFVICGELNDAMDMVEMIQMKEKKQIISNSFLFDRKVETLNVMLGFINMEQKLDTEARPASLNSYSVRYSLCTNK